ncbi:pyruvate:ferredoxin (flavodoxin) oxidoreductase [Nostoc sp. UHCC 0251]|uniref:pyruvate:ferredoxin (flavodoxin) oxidoreductase n=1 Tax=Nostoc sp. UHCC 0251 TaxID=3110240 RepID=UPI002B1F98D2|nr:pyruvate:ferredoxin (flavodoxin) oxidoreductase [Nostoc sp. UHCC 0251]MEA5625012.1 pyruvate:ferredoxin (flavodoxin) oxidoreductase [Nostoc sp. UHCC 0251]
MKNKTFATIDGNEAVAQVVYRLNEVIAIYPITPSSPMAEWTDAWASEGKRNIWGTVPSVVQMQSEGGVAGAVHGALQTGSLTTTFTASQGLLLMIPNMYKIAGELTPTVFHIAARSLAAQALSIFGDHSDVMAARGTGFAMLCAASVQEAQDFALIATRATLESRIPFLHFFDGFRTSHEINKVETLTEDDLREFIPDELVFAHRSRALTPDKPVLRGTTQNPDVYFQARETVNPYYLACADITQKVMDEFARYGLSSKEFTPAMIKAVFDNLATAEPKNHFTIGINDDVTHTSLNYDPDFSIEADNIIRAIFYGLGADGTVGANKNSIKIIGEETNNYAQGYFVYDSKKSGSVTVSHLRFGSQPVLSTYLISKANFVACHQWEFIEKFPILKDIIPDGTFLVNSPYEKDEVWDHLPPSVQEQIIEKHLKFYVINAYKVARQAGMAGRINTVMQVCFFVLSNVLPREEAIAYIKNSIRKTYSKKGDEIVQMNIKAVDTTLDNLSEVENRELGIGNGKEKQSSIPDAAPAFVRDVLSKMIARQGDELPVSALPADGTYPTGTAKWEKRNIAQEIPVWDTDVCIQCGKCVMVCPHSVIRSKVYEPQQLENAPSTFKSANAKDHDWPGLKYTIQVAAEDCTGCGICVDVCPAKNKSELRRKAINMEPQRPLREQERENWDFFLNIPNPDRSHLKLTHINQQQMQEPLFEFSGACAGCGETPYIKLATQLFGDRMIVANATGCSSIYGGNLPTTPWTHNTEGRGPAWSNSLFEDNAEFGLGFRISIDKQTEFANELLKQLGTDVDEELVNSILNAEQKDEADIWEQRERVALLKQKLDQILTAEIVPNLKSKIQNLKSLADYLVKKSVWIIGGDGWGYDIGFGGLDHVLASGRNVNILILDTEVYSNTGGQMSKATPKAAVAKFAAGGKSAPKKDLGLMAMTYGNVYIASVAMGARDEHTLKAFLEAEAYQGPSLIIAYSHCIAHGINMSTAMQNQKAAVDSGQWLLYRFNPDRIKQGENPLQLDSRTPKLPLEQYMYLENRFKMLTKSNEEAARQLLKEAQADVQTRWQMYQYLAARQP